MPFVRMDAMKEMEALDNYFILLKSILDDNNNLLDKPSQIYNLEYHWITAHLVF